MAQIMLNYTAAQIDAAIAKINSLVTTIEGSIVQLYDSSAVIYPKTIADAVFLGNKSLSTKISETDALVSKANRNATINLYSPNHKILSSPKSRKGYIKIPKTAVVRLGNKLPIRLEEYFNDMITIDTSNAVESNMKVVINFDGQNTPTFYLKRTTASLTDNEYCLFQIRNSSGSLDFPKSQYDIEGFDYVDSISINKVDNNNNGLTLFDSLKVEAGTAYSFYIKSEENLNFRKAWVNLSLSSHTAGSIYLTSDEIYRGAFVTLIPQTSVSNIRLYMSMVEGTNGIPITTYRIQNSGVQNLGIIHSLKYIQENIETIIKGGGEYSGDKVNLNLYSFEKVFSVTYSHQCSGYYKGYILLIQTAFSGIYLYDVNKKEIVASYNGLSKVGDPNEGLYHCNCGSFTNIFWEENDEFPLFMVSQRNLNDKGFVQLLRIVVTRDEEQEISSFVVSVVQTINLPAYTSTNALRYPNCCYENRYLYSTSRYLEEGKENLTRVTKFNFPRVQSSVVNLTDDDIVDSFDIEFAPLNTQSSIIVKGNIYCTRGSASDAVMCIIDTVNKNIRNFIDLKEGGFSSEPEGIFLMDGNLYVSCNNAAVMKFNF